MQCHICGEAEDEFTDIQQCDSCGELTCDDCLLDYHDEELDDFVAVCEKCNAKRSEVNMTHDELKAAIDEACNLLPDGWNIYIEIERNAGNIYLDDPDGNRFAVDDFGCSDAEWPQQIADAVQYAVDNDGEYE